MGPELKDMTYITLSRDSSGGNLDVGGREDGRYTDVLEDPGLKVALAITFPSSASVLAEPCGTVECQGGKR